MRALFIGSYPNGTDPYRSIFFRELIYQFARQGVACTVVTPISATKYKDSFLSIPVYDREEVSPGTYVDVYRPRTLSFSAKKIGRWNTIHVTLAAFDAAVMKQVRKLEGKFDFVYGHFFLGGGLTAAKVGRALNIPAYIAYGECSFETEVSVKYGNVRKEELKGVHGFVSVSSANTEDLARRGLSEGIPVLTSLNSVDTSVFHCMDQAACRKKMNLPDSDFLVGFVGGFIPRKGHKRVLEACRGLENVKLVFAGRGEDQPEGEQVVFCEGIPHDQVAVLLNAVDVFVLPTLNEGCCNAVIEAMSCGKAIVSSDLPFNHDVLNRHNSILVDPNSIDQIREAVIRLRDDPVLRKRLADRALEDAAELTIEQRAKNILAFIQETM